MMNKPGQPDKARVYAFGNKRLVLLACMVLLLIALSMMLGIRIERHQQSAALIPPKLAAPPEPVICAALPKALICSSSGSSSLNLHVVIFSPAIIAVPFSPFISILISVPGQSAVDS